MAGIIGSKNGALQQGATIGILGGGQLGRMSAVAAAHLGFKTHLYCPEADPPAAQVCTLYQQASFEDEAALRSFAKQVDVVTLEFENIPTSTLDFLYQLVPTRPSGLVLEKTQDRLIEKNFVRQQGIGTADYVDCASYFGAEEGPRTVLSFPAILKTRRMGYDGKGQVRVKTAAEAEEAWQKMGQPEAILESFIPFDHEVSIIVARNHTGQMQTYPTVENVHRDGILFQTHAPSRLSLATERRAGDMAKTLAEALGLEGLLAIELFVSHNQDLLINELAPRPHNSGHWSMDGCGTSQFEQHIRAVAGLPLGGTQVLHPTLMQNLIGDEVLQAMTLLSDPSAHLHLYGKEQVKAGRKMGHVNWLKAERE